MRLKSNFNASRLYYRASVQKRVVTYACIEGFFLSGTHFYLYEAVCCSKQPCGYLQGQGQTFSSKVKLQFGIVNIFSTE